MHADPAPWQIHMISFGLPAPRFKEKSMDSLSLRNLIGSKENFASGVPWGAIICGAYAAAVISLVLLVFGAELGDNAPVFRIF